MLWVKFLDFTTELLVFGVSLLKLLF